MKPQCFPPLPSDPGSAASTIRAEAVAPTPPRLRLLTIACALACASLSLPAVPAMAQSKAPAPPPAPAAKPTKAQLAADLAAALQACSYDGSPVKFAPPDLSQGSGAEGTRVVAEIMKYTGLPQNFDVVRGQVPNAAAVIVAGPDRIPRRVIAYNPQFMGDVTRATKNNNWAPVSIMAHEIGHHLSGHTIVPGGSQPPIELEADKFSGFVLYKMGASLADSLKAIETLVPEQDGQTHPGRRKRVAAIAEGWKQACRQQSNQCDGTALAAAPTSAPAPAAPPAAVAGKSEPPAPPPASISAKAPAAPIAKASPPPEPTAGPIAKLVGTDVIPVPGKHAIPSKFDRFVMDETGLVHPNAKAKIAKAMYDFAKEKDVEVVTLIVNSTHGMSADEYAHAMMRLLRVGKMETGNGAVLVVAPKQEAVGVALGAGLAAEIDETSINSQLKEPLSNFYKMGLKFSKGKPLSESSSEQVGNAADFVRRAAKNWEWRINYPVYEDYVAVRKAEEEANRNGSPYNPATSKTFRRLVRVQGVVTSLNGAKEYTLQKAEKWRKHVLEASRVRGGNLIELKTSSGDILLIHVDGYAQKMMTTQLAEGKAYQFTLRTAEPWDNKFNALSFDALRFN
jgi:hypothetical protein